MGKHTIASPCERCGSTTTARRFLPDIYPGQTAVVCDDAMTCVMIMIIEYELAYGTSS